MNAVIKNKAHTFICAYGRTHTGKTVRFRLLDKSGSEVQAWTTSGVTEIGYGRYGVTLTLTDNTITFIQWHNQTEDTYIVDAITMTNINQEQSFISSFGRSRTGKTIKFRLLDSDGNALAAWSTSGVIEIGNGYYGVVTKVLSSSTAKYIQYCNETDSLYLADPVNLDMLSGYEYAGTEFFYTLLHTPFKIDIDNRVLDYKMPNIIIKTRINNLDKKLKGDLKVSI